MLPCPVCNQALRAVLREGVEIDVCPRCRGVWLDRGELDTLLQCSALTEPYEEEVDRDHRPRPVEAYGPPPPTRESRQPHPPKKQESFWSRVFDFD